MDKQQKAELAKLIENKIKENQLTIMSLKEKTEPIAPDVAIGRLSRMEAINEKSMLEANLRQTQEQNQQLKQALLRLDHEGFGYCEACDEVIPIERILLMPHTRFCVNCAE